MSRSEKAAGGAYEVGKGKPPKKSRWKKGRSGNPRGRPKAQKLETIDVAEILNAPTKARIGGKKTELSSSEACFRRLAQRALKDHLPSIKGFIKICEEHGLIALPSPDPGGGVIVAPKGYSPWEWAEVITGQVPIEALKSKKEDLDHDRSP